MSGLLFILPMVCAIAGTPEVEPATWSTSTVSELDRVRSLLVQNPSIVESRDGVGMTPLHWASYFGNWGVVSLLIEKGAEVNAQDDEGKTSLHWAAQGANMACAELLMHEGADVNVKDRFGRTPLHVAASACAVNVASVLINAGADRTAKDSAGYTPVVLAAMHHDLAARKIARADADRRMMLALELRDELNLSCVPESSKASIYSSDVTTFAAILLGDMRALKDVLARQPEAVNEKGPLGRTPLHWSAATGRLEAARLLVRSGADLTSKDPEGRTAVLLALEEGFPEVAKALEEMGVPLDVFAASALNRPELLEEMLSSDEALLEARDKKGRTPLHWACRHGATGAARKLLEKGANINAQDSRECYPVELAARRGRGEVIPLLFASKPPPVQSGQKGGELLHLAARGGHVDTLKALLRLALPVDRRDKKGRTALHWASGYGHVGACKCLIDAGADANAGDSEGNTPLHFAARCLHLPVARTLVAAGAKLSVRNKIGDEPGTHMVGPPMKADEMRELLWGSTETVPTTNAAKDY